MNLRDLKKKKSFISERLEEAVVEFVGNCTDFQKRVNHVNKSRYDNAQTSTASALHIWPHS